LQWIKEKLAQTKETETLETINLSHFMHSEVDYIVWQVVLETK